MPTAQLLGLFVTIAGLFGLGGSSRTDVQSLTLLYPFCVVSSGLALFTLRRDHLSGRYWLLGGFAVIMAGTALYLLPTRAETGLPIVLNDPGFKDVLTGTGSLQANTIAPSKSLHSLLSLFAPLAVLLFGIQLSRNELLRTLPYLIAVGALSGFIGLLQIVGDPEGSLYFYRITNNGSAVGLMANRNHAALLLGCLFPMLAVYAALSSSHERERGGKKLISIAIGIVSIPLILVTGSRSGMLIAVVGIVAAAVLYRTSAINSYTRGKRLHSSIFAETPFAIAVSVACLGLLTTYFSRAEAIDRLFAETTGQDSRGDLWKTSAELFPQYLPFGSGPGTFAEAYQVVEAITRLDGTYLNRAHNDWIETVVTFGVPGALILAAFVLAYLWRAFVLWRRMDGNRRSVLLGRMASIVIAMIGAASVSDYPLRTPAMMGFVSILLLWFVEAGRQDAWHSPVRSEGAKYAGQ